MNAPLYNRVKALTNSGTYPLHMPGHKRCTALIPDNLLQLDITEIDGSDNMHCPTGVILEAEKLLAELNGCDKSLFLVNGGSGGILTAILGTLNEGERIIVCRNAHKSVHNALVLSGAVPVYICPEVLSGTLTGGISQDTLEKAFLQYPDTKAVLITSPTYEGFTSNISAIAEITHKHNAILIVDETHGAHFAFSNAFPKSAITLGADITVNSWHKTLPCPNQSAVININTKRVDFNKIKEAYSMVQTTSPSYIMLSLMDKTRAMLTEDKSLIANYIKTIILVRERLNTLNSLKLTDKNTFKAKNTADYDISKLVIMTGKNFSGKALAQILLKEYNIQTELADACHIIAMTSIADTEEQLMRFADALAEIDKRLNPYVPVPAINDEVQISATAISPRKAFYAKTAEIDLFSSAGLVAGECITPFPPDVPLIITGERITNESLDKLKTYIDLGVTILGGENSKIKVIEEK